MAVICEHLVLIFSEALSVNASSGLSETDTSARRTETLKKRFWSLAGDKLMRKDFCTLQNTRISKLEMRA